MKAMENDFVLVRSDTVRDFDDIYEGGMIEAIAPRQELIEILSNRLGIDNWTESATHDKTWTGDSSSSQARASLLVGNGDVAIILTLFNTDPSKVDLLRSDLDLRAID